MSVHFISYDLETVQLVPHRDLRNLKKTLPVVIPNVGILVDVPDTPDLIPGFIKPNIELILENGTRGVEFERKEKANFYAFLIKHLTDKEAGVRHGRGYGTTEVFIRHKNLYKS